ncbi:MAG: GWxTD domain-containing protein [Flavobacteriales bacterium]
MFKLGFYFLFFICYFFSNSLFSQSIQAQFDFAKFQSDGKTYIETYLAINSASSDYIMNNNGNYQSSATISIQFISDNAIYKADKYNLNSPEVNDTSEISFVFVDQQRYVLDDGTYTLKLTIESPNDSSKNLSYEEDFIVSTDIGFSDIQLVESYTESSNKTIISKSGYDLVPFISNFYNQENDKIIFYIEFYSDFSEQVLLQVKLMSQATNEVVKNFAISKKSEGNNSPLLGSFSLSDVSSGTYYLEAVAINSINEIISSKKKVFFNLNNKVMEDDNQFDNTFVSNIKNKDSLKTFIQYLYPIQSTSEDNFTTYQLDYDDLEMMQNYFYAFWKKRNPFDTENEWKNYLKQIKTVNKSFSNGLFKGFMTDRGRIYLAYGSPNSMTQEVFPNQFEPFEVWHYYEIESERNIKFVFSNKNMPNEYRLVYSNKQGEITDLDWLNRFEGNYYDSGEIGKQSPFDYFQTPN